MTTARRCSRLRQWLIVLILPLVVVSAALWVEWDEPPLRTRLRDIAFDQLQRIYPNTFEPDLPVRVVAIDEASLQHFGQWPWPRNRIAALVERLFDLGADTIAFDILFFEPDRTDPQQLAALWPAHPDLQRQLRALPSHDAQLAASFTRGKVVLSTSLDVEATAATQRSVVRPNIAVWNNAQQWLPHYDGELAILPQLKTAAAGIGFTTMRPREDESFSRALPLLHYIQNNLYPALGLAAFWIYYSPDSRLDVTAIDNYGLDGLMLDSDFIPCGLDGSVHLHYRRLQQERYLSAQAVLSGTIPKREIAGHLIFIAATAEKLGDMFYNPFGERVPGVEGHLQLVEQIITGQLLLPLEAGRGLFIAVLLITWLALAVLLRYLKPIWAVLFTVLVLTSLFGTAAWLLIAQQRLWDPLYPALAISALFFAIAVPRYVQTEQERRWIYNAFSRYVSPNRVKCLQADPQLLELGGVYRECSFVMTDLQGFTSLIEKHEPTLLAARLNDYLDGMIQIAFRHDGTLDRIVGDAVAVMFSAPVMQPDHAARALTCALEMERFARAFSNSQQQQGLPFGLTRIGVHTGMVMVGNFGGKAILDYRALGDAINTAARLETLNAHLGTHICVSGATLAQTQQPARPVGQIILKGKTEPITIHEPLGCRELPDAAVREYLAAYTLLEAAAPEALAAFTQLTAQYPEDPLARFHAQRLQAGEVGALIVMTKK
ncbi:adenylate/guanylate cyclase domain-containing protein [Rhodoferax sp. 4810]|uniref:Adenylate/guanylate cyclase domain-containing protein n=1 Tax=Thiospirillum jenense TaxID=1653858 RepID=A0A839H8G1_9GAMM|nr:adenylate/guanylate cyclase domain-containing protein [Thiospirillum jenense]MBB1072954.1 adenylate/guanylate cyclase domain-containing protein [Rhodoferax jenense]MBB1124900.1 adenylate/guanylate cyclase domain-containing protein [Thiospirillum jenense]